MKSFSYVAFTRTGKRKTGTLVGESERDASEKLKSQGLFPSEITAQVSPVRSGGRQRRLDPDTRAVFTRQMAVLLSSDLSAEAALDAVLQSDGTRALHTFAGQVKAAVMDGYPLSRAMHDCGGGFERFYTSALRAGERSGDLGAVFDQLAEYLEGRRANRSQLASALIYPAFVAAVSLAVCAVLLTNVAPEIVAMFEVSGQPLPPLTRVVMSLADWIGANWIVLSGGLIAFAAGFAGLLKVAWFRNPWDRAMLRLPIVGRQLRLTSSAQYLRTLALVLASRQTVLDGVTSAAEVLVIAQFRAEGDAVTEALRTGESLSRSLTRLSPLPAVTRQLVHVGEQTARLAQMTDRAAFLVESWRNDEQKRLATILDPILMMLVGVLVLTIVLAILLPIFDLQSVVS